MSGVDEAQRAAKRAANSTWAQGLARVGFCARGVVYAVVGVIALRIAWSGRGGNDASKEGALREISERPFSGVLLVVLAVGMAGYALWRATEAAWGHRDEPDEPKRTVKRVGSGAKALVYGALLASTLRFLVGGPDEAGRGEEERSWTAQAMDLPGGRVLVVVTAIAILGAGGYIAYRGLSQRFEKRLDTTEMGPLTGRAVDVVGTVGLAARGAVVSVAGFLLLRAALDHDPDEARGVDGTLKVIARQAYGKALLTATAFGIIAYGLYSFAEARYRRL